MTGDEADRSREGTIVGGRYRIERLLGSGGLGNVYLASRTDDGLPVALKLLHDPERSHGARFQREAEVIAGLTHPGIVRMLDFGEDSALSGRFLVMEHLDGEPLAALIERGLVAWPFALHLIWWLATALAEAHERGIVHRDVKPDNVILQTDAHEVRPVLIDFGIARAEDDRYEALTAEGALMGTPAYMSPEQARNARVGPSTDIYALGVVLFEMLTGEVPFPSTGGVGGLLLKLRNPAPPLAAALPPGIDVPPDVHRLVADLLETELSDRIATAEAVANRIATLLAPDPSRFTLDQQHDATLQHWMTRPDAQVAEAIERRSASTPPADATIGWGTIVLAVALSAGLVLGVLTLLGSDDEPDLRERTDARETLPGTRPEPPLPSRVDAALAFDTGPASFDDADRLVAADIGSPELEPPLLPVPSNAHSAGCGRELGSELHSKTIPWGEGKLRWFAWVPTSYDPLVPHRLVVLLHSRERDARHVIEHRNFKPIAERERLILVAPDATSDGKFGGKELRAMPAIVAKMGELACLDRRWVYALGVARGEDYARRLAVHMPLSATGGGNYRRKAGDFDELLMVVPHIHLFGVDSNDVPRNGGQMFPCNNEPVASFDDEVEFWRGHHKCDDITSDYPHHSGYGTCHTWECEIPYVVCEVEGGRPWSGENLEYSPFCVAKPSRFDHAETIWTFFEEHGRPIPLDP